MDTVGTTAVCLEYGGIHISWASDILLVGVVMCTRASEHYKATFLLPYDVEKG